MSSASAVSLNELKEILARQLCDTDRMKRPEGLSTGFSPLDRFLESGGLPKGGLSLLKGAIGTGATSLWMEAALKVVASGRWVAWINSDIPLVPTSLAQRGLDFSRFIVIEKPESNEKLFWLLQELMSSGLFEMIGCDFGSTQSAKPARGAKHGLRLVAPKLALPKLVLKEHQLRKLQAQARQSHTALVFLSHEKSKSTFPHGSLATVFSLILNFKHKELIVERAQHRPTPHSFTRSFSYARFTAHSSPDISGSRPTLRLATEHSSHHQKSEPRPRAET